MQFYGEIFVKKYQSSIFRASDFTALGGEVIANLGMIYLNQPM